MAGRELTVPEVAQSVILTRLGGGKTPMPPGEEVRDLARHGTTMAVFLSAARSGQLQAELLAGGYPPETPVIVAYQATWPDELMVECTVGTLAETVRARKLWKHTLFLVGPALGARRHPVAPVSPRPLPRFPPGRPGRPHRAARGQPVNGSRPQPSRKHQQLPPPHGPQTPELPTPELLTPELREPDLPRTARVRPRALRTGWTTGTCASAAAKAAATALRDQAPQHRVEIALPSGRRVAFPVESCAYSPQQGTAVVVKDAGDDPDVTHGAHLTAMVRWRAEPGVTLEGGEGVGVVTKPGLGIEVGEPAITATPAGHDHRRRWPRWPTWAPGVRW